MASVDKPSDKHPFMDSLELRQLPSGDGNSFDHEGEIEINIMPSSCSNTFSILFNEAERRNSHNCAAIPSTSGQVDENELCTSPETVLITEKTTPAVSRFMQHLAVHDAISPPSQTRRSACDETGLSRDTEFLGGYKMDHSRSFNMLEGTELIPKGKNNNKNVFCHSPYIMFINDIV